MMQELPCVRTPQRGRDVSVMDKTETTASIFSVELKGLETYEVPTMFELGTVEDLTWTGSTDTFTIST